MTIEAVLFDLGGVYTDSPFDAVHAVGEELGVPPDEMVALLFGLYDRDTDHPWHQLERGEITLEATREGVRELAAERGLEIDLIQVLARVGSGRGGTRDTLVERTLEIRSAGYKTALVTNNFAEVRLAWRRMLPVEDLFDVIVDSSEIGIRKPDPAIYHHALEQLGAKAEHSVFLDDYPANVSVAIDLGMRGILVDPDIPRVIRELDALLSGS